MGAKAELEFTAENSRLLKALAGSGKAVSKLEAKLAKAGRAGKKAGKQVEKSFGSTGAVAGLKRYVGGLVSITAAAGAAAKALRDLSAARDEAANKVRESESGLAQLSELAGGDRDRLHQLKKYGKEMYLGGGAASLDQSYRAIYALESADALGSRELLTRMYGTIKDPALFARAITTMQASAGVEEAGSFKALATKAVLANPDAPATGPALMMAAAKAMKMTKQLGWSDEATLAATTYGAKSTGEASEGGTLVSGFATALIRQGGFVGLSLEESVQKLSGMRLDWRGMKKLVGVKAGKRYEGKRALNPEQMMAFLGRKEAASFYAVMKDALLEYREIRDRIDKGQDSDILEQMITSRDSVPELVAASLDRKSKAKKEIAESGIGVRRALTDALIDRIGAEETEAGRNEVAVVLGRWGLKTQRFFVGDKAFFESRGHILDQRSFKKVSEAAEGGDRLYLPDELLRAREAEAAKNRKRDGYSEPSTDHLFESGVDEMWPVAAAINSGGSQVVAGMATILPVMLGLTTTLPEVIEGMKGAAIALKTAATRIHHAPLLGTPDKDQ